jgi:hypothetical protein
MPLTKKESVIVLLLGACVVCTQSSNDCSDFNDVPGQNCDDSDYFIAVIFSVITILCTLALLFIMNDALLQIFSPIFTGLWAAAAWIFTFSTGVYAFTGNAYFAIWICFMASVYLLFMVFSVRFQIKLQDPFFVAFLLAACTLLIDASLGCDDAPNSECTDEYAYAVALSVLTIVALIIIIVLKHQANPNTNQIKTILSCILLALWIFGAGYLTMGTTSPYLATGNGYFAIWVGFSCAGMWVFSSLPDKYKGSRSNNNTAKPPPTTAQIGGGSHCTNCGAEQPPNGSFCTNCQAPRDQV